MKRQNGAGSVYRRKDGRWVAKVWDPTQGKFKYRYAATRNKADAALRDMLNRVGEGLPPVDASRSFRAYAENWLDGPAGRRRAPSTVYEYRSRLERHAYPLIGHVALNRITVRDVESILDGAAGTGVSLSTVRGLRNALSALFADAKKDRLIAANPARSAEMPILEPPRRRKEPSTQELRDLLARADKLEGDDAAELGRILTMCAHTGARIGEVLTARWGDFEPDLAAWHVRRTISKGIDGRMTVRPSTKNGDDRTVALTSELRDALRKQSDYVAYRSSTARLWDDEDWVFPSSTGTVRDEHNLRRFLKRTFPDWPYAFHGIRHWFISMGLLRSGAGEVQVSKLVGHRSTRTTRDVYGHLLDEGAEIILNEVSKALKLPTESP